MDWCWLDFRRLSYPTSPPASYFFSGNNKYDVSPKNSRTLEKYFYFNVHLCPPSMLTPRQKENLNCGIFICLSEYSVAPCGIIFSSFFQCCCLLWALNHISWAMLSNKLVSELYPILNCYCCHPCLLNGRCCCVCTQPMHLFLFTWKFKEYAGWRKAVWSN